MLQYLHSTLNPLDILENWVIIDYFIHTQGKKQIHIQEGVTSCEYFYIMEDSSLDLEILVSSPGVRLQIYGLVFGKEEMVCHTQLILQANDIQANMHLISIVQEGAQIQHRGTITIQPHFRQIESHLLEEHVMLGDNIRVRAQPVLQIASHDVRASHGAKIERLDEEKLLYMMSRGLTRVQSQKLILNWYLSHIAEQLSTSTTPQEQQQIQEILGALQTQIA